MAMISQIASIFIRAKPYSTLEDENEVTMKVSTPLSKKDNSVNVFGRVDNNPTFLNEANKGVESWDYLSMVTSTSTMASTASTLNTNEYFGFMRRGKSDITVDAFIGLQDSQLKASSKKTLMTRAHDVPSNYEALLNTTLNSISERDFGTFYDNVKTTPSLLLYECKKRENQDIKKVRGCYGGALLHVMVSQKPSLKKKRVTKASNHALNKPPPKAHNDLYEIHIMPSVPESVLLFVIKRKPEVLSVTDDHGRLPLHCATLSLSNHLEEMSRLYGIPGVPNSAKSEHSILRYVMREINVVEVLLKYYQNGASKSDNKGNLPLHYAVAMPPDYKDPKVTITSKSKKGCPPCAEQTVRLLLDSYPRGIGIENKKGQLPIHTICSKGPMINLTSLQHLLFYHHKWRDIPSDRDSSGDPPLHLAIKSRASHIVIQRFASFDPNLDTARLFIQRDGSNNNPLHIALALLHPPPGKELISVIMSVAPSTAGSPNNLGTMPIKFATKLKLSDGIICKMLAEDMPVEIGTLSSGSSFEISDSTIGINLKQTIAHRGNKFTGQVIEKSHYHSWWHVAVECKDRYITMLQNFLSKEATHSQIVALARQTGPDGKSIVINCVTERFRLMMHSLLLFYDRYEILLSSQVTNVQIQTGIQLFHAMDFGPVDRRDDSLRRNIMKNRKPTSVKMGGNNVDNTSVEVSLLSKEKGKVLLRCYQYEAAFLAEIKVREIRNLSSTFVEEIYNHHRDENYSHLTLSKAEKLCCIAFERPDHTLEEVFGSISSSNRSQKWIEKCWVVLRQIAEALKHFHDNNLIHGHLNSANVAKYGNLWKLNNVGTVVPVGSPLRGLVRPCAPPESVIESMFIKPEECVQYIKNKPREIHDNKVKFSFNVSEENEENENVISNRLEPQVSTVKLRSRSGSEKRYTTDFFNFPTWGGRNSGLSRTRNRCGIGRDGKAQTHTTVDGVKVKCHLLFAPEKCMASPAWDIWGFGLVMVQLLLGRCTSLPNFEKADDAILRNLHNYDNQALKNIVLQVDKVIGKDAADLVSKLLQRDPSARPESMDAVLKHKYFQKLTIYI